MKRRQHALIDANDVTLVLVFLVALVFALKGFASGVEGAQAAGEAHGATGHGAPHEIPKVVFYQAVNVSGLILLFYFLLRKKAKLFFEERHEKVAEAIDQAKQAHEEAQKRHEHYKLQIKSLETEADSHIDAVHREGEEAKQRMIAEAKLVAKNIEAEARKSAANEIEAAKLKLRDEVVGAALVLAREALSKSVAQNDQHRLQQEFVDKIQAVGK